MSGWSHWTELKPGIPHEETAPPLPNDNEIEGWFNYQSAYREAAQRFGTQTRPVLVEVGCWAGASTIFLAAHLPTTARLYAVDTWLGSYNQPDLIQKARDNDIYHQFLRYCAQYHVLDRVVPIRLPSTTAAQLFDDRSCDFVYVDACHAYDAVMADLIAWTPKVKPGGVIAGHDYNCDTHKEVTKAVHDYFPASAIQVKSGGVVWWVEVHGE